MEEFDGTNEGTQGTVDQSKYKKLEMPMYLDENPESWVYHAEHFFEINNLPETEKVKVDVVSFGQDEGARLIRIQQDRSYNDYVKKFVNYSAPLLHMAESVLRNAFVTSLEPAL
ncbi:retrotransposon protein [Cucumis melo var. makuwa]|uniref:Retrotransposon protein n=1 Tax=Cucumis melo var. makuwa TaxID=1194695 RepID=A0A5A7UCJ7_CUCMM|nr:retrotransposon protein [Cucumis melo var. makuwa]